MRKRYIGLLRPEEEFEALRPAFNRLWEMERCFHPASPEYRALSALTTQFRATADLITKREHFLMKPAGDSATIGRGTGYGLSRE